MKSEDPRVTEYALGELQGAAREEFETELAQSDALQCELEETALLCQKLSALPREQLSFDEKIRAQLREACLQNARIVRREHRFRRAAWLGSVGALAACVLFALLTPRTATLPPEPASEKTQGADKVAVKAQLESSPALVQSPKGTPQILLAEAPPAPAAPREKENRPSTPQVSARPRSVAAEGTPREFMTKSSVLFDANTVAGAAPAASFPVQETDRQFNTETYDAIEENQFRDAKQNPLSTFSIDVDTASYSNVRRFLLNDELPPAGAVRIEEFINYFRYAYQEPKAEGPFSVNVEVSRAPWNSKHELVRIGLKGRTIPMAERPSCNLVFLIDVSGSMQDPNKLPLLKRSLRALVENLSPKDRVAIVVYAGSSGLVLPSTPGAEKDRILKVLDELEAGGSTNGGEGIQLSYQTARENFSKEANNRVILCTDGDFNVGVTSQSELISLIEKERASGIFLSVLGFGAGNLKDSTMEKLADKGNGNYSYIDSLAEGRRVLVEQLGATLFTIAKDVKVQVEFNPARVSGYRLIGYENRLLAKEDFNDDRKDAGEIGTGHTVTALYEIVPAGEALPDQPSIDPLKYQRPDSQVAASADELLTVKLRYKAPDGDKSNLIEFPVKATLEHAFDKASQDFQFAAAVAAFGMKLRNSPNAGDISWQGIQEIARRNLGEDPGSYRAEFLTLVERARELSESKSSDAKDLK
jgi:Ca-activated chloride channel family protein